jgi:NAD(P)-dependent dehydrogenase (short-subunit alcohol dehydrogenase family)
MPLAYMSDANKVAVVTGSSSGIGYETSLALAREGFLTYATMRNLEKGSSIKSDSEKENLPLKIMHLDVTDDASVSKAVQSIISDSGRIDVLVNNAGYGLVGAFEDLSLDEIKQQYETNFFGVVRVTQAVIPIMRKQKSGRIINISSGAGRFGYPGGSAYVSTKFAIEGLSESLSYELDPFGIKVILVEPGVIRTNFGNGMVVAKKSQDPGSAYLSMTRKMNEVLGQLTQNGSPPSLVANVVLQAAKSDNPNLRYLAGKDVEQWVDQKKKMSDKEFFNMMNQSFK